MVSASGQDEKAVHAQLNHGCIPACLQALHVACFAYTCASTHGVSVVRAVRTGSRQPGQGCCASGWPAQAQGLCTQVWLVAQDQYGNTQPSATGLNLTTAADVAAPALLDGTRPAQVGLCWLGLGILHGSCMVMDLASRTGGERLACQCRYEVNVCIHTT